MDEELSKLRQLVTKEQEKLNAATGKACVFSEHGPISMGLAKAIIAAVEAQAKEIAAIKEHLKGLPEPSHSQRIKNIFLSNNSEGQQ